MARKRSSAKRKKLMQKKGERTRRINRTVGILNNLTGYMTEQRFLAAFDGLDVNRDEFPDWFKGVIQSSLRQDMSGIDFIIKTDCGNFNFQIKSSETRALAFKAKRSNQDISTLAVIKSDTPEYIRYQVFSEISILREERLENKRLARKRRRQAKADRKASTAPI